MIIKLVGVNMRELESALRYSGLYVDANEQGDYAEIKAIPSFIMHDDVHTMGKLKDKFELSKSEGK